MNPPESPRSWLSRVFGNPVVGITGSIASILGILLSIYFFVAAHERRDLTYFVHPVKAAVIRAGQFPKLQVSMDQKPVKGDVTAAQVAFWNAGRRPIRQEEVLRQFSVRTKNGARILEARLRKVSRDVAGIALETGRSENGLILIRWKILERNDGGVIQIIYEGDDNVPILADAIIEGQASLSLLQVGQGAGSQEQYERSQSEARFVRRLYAAVGVSILVVYGFLVWYTKSLGYKVPYSHWVILVQATAFLGGGLFLYLRATPLAAPPFGF